MAVACGLCAGSNYFNQPLLHSIATQLQVRDASAALIVTLAQVAYAAACCCWCRWVTCWSGGGSSSR